MADDGAGLADAPDAIAGLVLNGRVPPSVIQHHMAGRREVQSGSAGLERQDHGSRLRLRLEICDHAVSGPAAETAVVALDGLARAFGQIGGELVAP